MEMKLPAPSLVVLVGPSGAGKSTWASENFRPNEIVSSDALRALVGIDENDQQASTKAFDLLERAVAERISRGLTTVVDTTGLDEESRARWRELAHQADIPAFAVLFPTPAAECHRRNDERGKPIPKAAVNRQATAFKKARASIEAEGFDGVITEQPVALVAPQMVVEDPVTTSQSSGQRSHTFGLILSRFNWPGSARDRAAQVADVATRAEQAGFRDIWLMDHFRQIRQVGRPWEDIPECYTTLSFLAGVTSTIRLGALVTGVTYRNPVLLGKMIATLDVLSGGRAICGLGAAWDEEEHRAYGFEFPSVKQRYEVLEDALELLPLLWGKGTPEFNGRTIAAEALVCYPRPLQERIPILIGGSGEKKTLRLVARHADACNLFGAPERVAHKVEILRRHCSEVDRDPSEIEVSHLVNVVAAADQASLRDRVDRVRPPNESPEEFARRNNAATTADLTTLFTRYAAAGAHHSIVSMPDVHLDGSIEAFADVISTLDHS